MKRSLQTSEDQAEKDGDVSSNEDQQEDDEDDDDDDDEITMKKKKISNQKMNGNYC